MPKALKYISNQIYKIWSATTIPYLNYLCPHELPQGDYTHYCSVCLTKCKTPKF